MAGFPTVFLTTTGARSGLARTVPLGGIPAGDQLAVIGSNFGQRSHPGWVHNLLADPRAVVTRGGRQVDVLAREVSGAEAEDVWRRARAMYTGYAAYPARTSGRIIRVFVLEPR